MVEIEKRTSAVKLAPNFGLWDSSPACGPFLDQIWAQSDFIFLLLKPAPFYGVSLAGVSLHCLQNPRLAKSGLKIQESIEKKNWPNFGANPSLGDKLGIWWIWSATISLITGAHYYCGDSLVNLTRRQNYCENKREANWPNCAAGTSNNGQSKGIVWPLT